MGPQANSPSRAEKGRLCLEFINKEQLISWYRLVKVDLVMFRRARTKGDHYNKKVAKVQSLVFGQVICMRNRQVNLILCQPEVPDTILSSWKPPGKVFAVRWHCWSGDQSREYTHKGINRTARRGRWHTVTLTQSPRGLPCSGRSFRAACWGRAVKQVLFCFGLHLKDKPRFIKSTRAGVMEEDLSKSKCQSGHILGTRDCCSSYA